MAEKSFGRVIKDRRYELSLTQEMVAKKVGVKANYIGYLERSMRHPSQKVVVKLSTALNRNAPELYLLANPKVRSLLRKAKPSMSMWQRFIRDVAQQKQQGLSRAEQQALAQLVAVEKATSLTGMMEAVRALRWGFAK